MDSAISATDPVLSAMLIVPHRVKTRTIDVPGIAKRKRVAKEHQAFVARLLTPRDQRPPKKSKWASRPFPKRSKP